MKKHGFDPENPPFTKIYTLKCPDPEVIISQTGILLPEKNLVLLYENSYVFPEETNTYTEYSAYMRFASLREARDYIRSYYTDVIKDAERLIKIAMEMIDKADTLSA